MNKNPLISCIMPAYNAERYIAKSIQSILNQSFCDFELIIINDGSTDDTENIILSFDDPRIVYVKNERNLKIIKTLNKGLDLAKGKYISRMDSDDIALPELFEKEIKIFENRKDIGIVNILTYHLTEDGCHIRPNRQYFRVSPEVMSYVCFYANMISHPGVMVRAELMKKYKYLDSPLVYHYEDKELWTRMFKDGIRCFTIGERLLEYRQSSTSINALHFDESYQRRQIFTSQYCKERWGYEWKTLPRITSFSIMYKHIIELFSLWIHLAKTNQISAKVFLKVLLWQSRFFIGLSKGLL